MARLSTITSLFLLVAIALAIATPDSQLPSSNVVRNRRRFVNGIPRDVVAVPSDPQTAGIGQAILKIFQTAADMLGGLFGGCGANEGAIMAQYTQTTLDGLQKEFPYKNIMLIHPKHSANLDGSAVHLHYDLDTQCFGRHAGYDAYVFDSGDIDLQGDRGWENWGFAGNYVWDKENNGNHVHFDPIVRAVPPPPPPPPAWVVPLPTRANASSTDGNYLVDCYKAGTAEVSSGVAYYKNFNPHLGNIYQQPDDYVDVTHGSFANWDGQGNVKFPKSGVTVSWSNYGSSEFFVLNHFSGIGDNGYQYWNIYRDNEYQLYETSNGWQCHVQYYMF